MKKILILIMFTSAIALSQEVNSGLSFLQLDIGARGVGLGSTGTAIIGPEAIFYNPAGLGGLNGPFAMFTHSSWLSNINYDYISYGQPLPYGYLGFGIKGLYVTDLEKRLADTPDPIANFGVYGFSGTISYAYPFTKKLSLGVNFSVISQIIDTYSGFTIAFGLGSNYKTPISGFDVGLSIINLGPKLKLNSENVDLPTKIRLGFAYSISEAFPHLFFDLTKGLNSGFGISSGLEYTILDMLALRAGYVSNEGITLGIGIIFSHFNLDYGFKPFSGLGFTHRITLIYNWAAVSRINPEDQVLATMRMTGERFYNDGIASMIVGNYDEAKRDFDIVTFWDSKNTKAIEKYAEADKKGKEKIVKDHFERAQTYYNNKNYLEAVAELEYVITIDSNQTQAKLLLAQSQAQLGRPVKGGSDFEAGLSYYGQGKYNDAISAWERVVQDNPDRTDIAGYIEAAKGKLKLAVDSLIDDAAKLEQQGQHKQALNKLNKALSINPQNQVLIVKIGDIRNAMLKETGSHLASGISFFEKHDYLNAESEFQIVLTLDPNNRDSKDYLKRIKSLKTTTHLSLLQKNIDAITAYVSGDYETAIRLWDDILNEDPKFPDARRNVDRARAMLQKMNR